MSQSQPFTPEEESEYAELDANKRLGRQVVWSLFNTPIDGRHEKWVKSKKERDMKKREQKQASWNVSQIPIDAGYEQEVQLQEEQEENDRRKKEQEERDQWQDRDGPSTVQDTPKYVPIVEKPTLESSRSFQHGSPDIKKGQIKKVEMNSQAVRRLAKAPARKSRGNLRYIRIHSSNSGWQPLIATLDTASELNWICPKVVDRLSLSVKSGLKMYFETFDGRKISSGSTVEPTWGIEGHSKTHKTEFRVAPKGAPFDVLFGRNFLESEEVDFDSAPSPIQVLAAASISKEEQKQIDKNEAAAKARRASLAQQSQPVKRDATKTKTSQETSKGNKRRSEEKAKKSP